MSANQSSSDVDAQNPTVVAHCTTCGDTHPLGDRTMGEITTVCPHCGSTGYTTEGRGDPIVKSDGERIADAVRDVDGVGDQTRRNIIRAFDSYYEFEAADGPTLQTIDGVGERTAERILDAQ